jgi:glycosyltransferase involved in cell wall biosynthesis
MKMPLHIAVIATMKYGLDHFIYREISVFAAQGASITIFPTKHELGLYNAREEWKVHHWQPLAVVLMQPFFLVRSPGRYLRLLWEALTVGALTDFVLAWYFARHMADVDVIYSVCGDHKLFIGYFCRQILGKPLAVTLHAYELYENPNPRLFVRALRACDQIITVTDYNQELLADQFHIDPSTIEVIRVSVDVEDYHPAQKFVILIVAFFDERKGHDVLFKAVRQLAQEDLEVWVVGGGSGRVQEVNVPALAAQEGVSAQVAFFGKLSGTALKAVYRACDVFCLPCRTSSRGIKEGFPTVLMEAMAFGKPVITTRHVEIPRIVPEILVDENDPEGLAQAIRQVYESKALRQRLGGQNRKIAETLFSLRNAEQTAKILYDLSHKRRISSRGQPET